MASLPEKGVYKDASDRVKHAHNKHTCTQEAYAFMSDTFTATEVHVLAVVALDSHISIQATEPLETLDV